MLGQVLTKAVSVIVVLYLARYLGKAGFGKFNLAFAYLLFFAIIIDFGIDQVVVRELAGDRERKNELIGNAIVVKMALAIISIILAIALLPLFHYPASTRLLIVVATGSLIFSLQPPSFGTVFTLAFTADLERVYVTLVDSVVRVLVSLVVLALAMTGKPLITIVAVNAFGLLPGFLIMAYLSAKKLPPMFKLKPDLVKYLLREAAPIALASIFVMVYFRIDVILLSIWKNEAAIGDYASAYKLTEAFTMLGGAMVTTLLPVAAKFHNDAGTSLARTYELSIKYLGMLMMPVAIGVFFFSVQIIGVLYSNGKYHSEFALTVLIWAELFILWNMILNTFLISINKQKIALYITMALVLVNVASNAVLIPLFSFNGAAIATLITELSFTVCAGLYLYRKEDLSWPSSFGRLLLVNIVFALGLSISASINVLVVTALAIPVYIVLLLVSGVISKSDKALLKAAFVRTG